MIDIYNLFRSFLRAFSGFGAVSVFRIFVVAMLGTRRPLVISNSSGGSTIKVALSGA